MGCWSLPHRTDHEGDDVMDTLVAAPVETVTEVKFSEALRLGRLTYPSPLQGGYFSPDGRSACAAGAIAVGLGYAHTGPPEDFLREHGMAGILLCQITADNDIGCTDDQIVARLESQGL